MASNKDDKVGPGIEEGPEPYTLGRIEDERGEKYVRYFLSGKGPEPEPDHDSEELEISVERICSFDSEVNYSLVEDRDSVRGQLVEYVSATYDIPYFAGSKVGKHIDAEPSELFHIASKFVEVGSAMGATAGLVTGNNVAAGGLAANYAGFKFLRGINDQKEREEIEEMMEEFKADGVYDYEIRQY